MLSLFKQLFSEEDRNTGFIHNDYCFQKLEWSLREFVRNIPADNSHKETVPWTGTKRLIGHKGESVR